MSERGYFSLRYTVPGFSFILVVVGINSAPITELLKATGTPDVYAAFFAFLSLLTGSALGFIVSQIYWWHFNRNEGILGIEKFSKVEDILKDFGFKFDEKLQKDKNKVVAAILDFVMYLEDKKFLAYVWRRWDMYHLLSATYYVLGIGLIVGIIIRISFEVCLYEINFGGYNPLENVGSLIFLLIIAGVIVMVWVLRSARNHLLNNYRPAFDAWIRDGFEKDTDRVKKAFPDYFPE